MFSDTPAAGGEEEDRRADDVGEGDEGEPGAQEVADEDVAELGTGAAAADDGDAEEALAKGVVGEAYIQSQRADGWVALPDRYHDGGLTGANMDRPALGRLLAHVAARSIAAWQERSQGL